MKLNRFALTFAVAAALAPFAVRAQDAPKAAPKSDAPTLCVVRGDVITDTSKATAKYTVGGKTYYTCCPGCKTKFDKSDDAARTKMAKVTDLRTEKVVLEKKLEQVNKELSEMEGKPAVKPVAVAAPAPAAANIVYCAVTDEEIGTPDKAAGGTMTVNGKTYYLCCPGCKPKFESAPAKFAAIADKKAAERAAKK
jgi:YHS domain-containing protein